MSKISLFEEILNFRNNIENYTEKEKKRLLKIYAERLKNKSKFTGARLEAKLKEWIDGINE